MQKEIYFVRHCEPNYDNHNDQERELTAKGLLDCQKITQFFKDKKVDAIYASTFKRAYDTVKDLADDKGLSIIQQEEFCERKISDEWIDDFNTFAQKQWQDFNYALPNGESLKQVQIRHLTALNALLKSTHSVIVIGSHGTALSALIHYYEPTFDYQAFCQIKSLFPFIVKMTFDDNTCQAIALYDIVNLENVRKIK